jgi:hypothetical protein
MPFDSQAASVTGTNGLFVVPSGDPAATPVLVDTTPRAGFYVKRYVTDSNGDIVQPKMSRLYYLTGTDANEHLYGLDLEDTSTPPVPAQISSLSLNADVNPADSFCYITSFNQTLNDPSTAIILIGTEGQGSYCLLGHHVLYMVHAGDSASTPPLVAPITLQDSVYPLYNAGTGNLNGLLYVDDSGNLTVSDTAFSHPHVLLTGVSELNVLYAQRDFVFAQLLVGGKGSLYRISANGISADLYDFRTSQEQSRFAIADLAGGNLWLTDNTGAEDDSGNVISYNNRLLRAPLSGNAAAQTIYTASGTLPSESENLYVIEPVGVIGSSLIFNQQFPYLTGNPPAQASVNTLPTSAAPGTAPAVIETLPSGNFFNGSVSNSMLFHTRYDITTTSTSTSTSSVVEALSVNGTILTSFAQAGILGTLSHASGTLQAPVITTPTLYVGEGYASIPPVSGGATIYAVSTSSLNQVALTLPDNAPFTVTTSAFPEIISGDLPVNGEASYASEFDSDSVAILNSATNIWYPIATPINSFQAPFYPAPDTPYP